MLIIGIAGGTGSGKTTVVKRITDALAPGEVVVMSQDSYYRDNSGIPLEERKKLNFDHPDSIEFDLLVQHIEELKKGNAIEQPTYSYLERGRSAIDVLDRWEKTLKPMHKLFIEPSRRHADIVVLNYDCLDVAINIILTVIDKKLGNHKNARF